MAIPLTLVDVFALFAFPVSLESDKTGVEIIESEFLNTSGVSLSTISGGIDVEFWLSNASVTNINGVCDIYVAGVQVLYVSGMRVVELSEFGINALFSNISGVSVIQVSVCEIHLFGIWSTELGLSRNLGSS